MRPSTWAPRPSRCGSASATDPSVPATERSSPQLLREFRGGGGTVRGWTSPGCWCWPWRRSRRWRCGRARPATGNANCAAPRPAVATPTSSRSCAPTSARTRSPRACGRWWRSRPFVMSFRASTDLTVVLLVLIVPAVISVVLGRNFVAEARVAQARAELERRAQEVLDQEELAPRRWAARLAPEDLPDVTGFEIGRVYQAGSGLMAGDFYDLVRLSPSAAGRGDRRRLGPWHRAGHHGLPGQVPAAGVPASVPRPRPGPRGAQRPDVGGGWARGVHQPVRGGVRHRGRHSAPRLRRSSRCVAVARA